MFVICPGVTFLHTLGSKIKVIKQLVLTLFFKTVPRALDVHKSRKTQSLDPGSVLWAAFPSEVHGFPWR